MSNLKPFKKGYDPRRHKKQKGEFNFKTIWRIATREVAETLKLGKKPNAVEVALVIRGIKEGLLGNYPFFNHIMERLYGKVEESLKVKAEIEQRTPTPEEEKESKELDEIIKNYERGLKKKKSLVLDKKRKNKKRKR